MDLPLNKLGLNPEEIKLYLFLLENGAMRAGDIAKQTGIVRSSLYGFLKRLLERGLIQESQQAGTKTFAAEKPEKVALLFNEEIDELEHARRQYVDLLPTLLSKQPGKLLSPKFQLFEGEAGLRHILKDMLLYRDLETQAYWPIKKMVEVLSPEFFRYFNKERIRRNLHTQAIWPEAETVDFKTHPYLGAGPEFLREIRIAPSSIAFTMGYWIYGNKVACISSCKEAFGFIIESSEFAEMLRSQFEILWQLSKPITPKTEDVQVFLEEIRS